jgi:ribonuclease HI
MKIFTDGSSYKNGKPDCLAGAGVYVTDKNDVYINELSYPISEAAKICNYNGELKQSNNTGELFAILLGFCSIVDKNQEISVYSDSMYCINSIVSWSKGWARNNWITSGGTPVKNKDLIVKIIEEKEKFNYVFFVHVKGHKTKPDESSEEYFKWFGNDRADFLATQGTKKARNIITL